MVRTYDGTHCRDYAIGGGFCIRTLRAAGIAANPYAAHAVAYKDHGKLSWSCRPLSRSRAASILRAARRRA